MTDSDYEFNPKKWRNTLGYDHFEKLIDFYEDVKKFLIKSWTNEKSAIKGAISFYDDALKAKNLKCLYCGLVV